MGSGGWMRSWRREGGKMRRLRGWVGGMYGVCRASADSDEFGGWRLEGWEGGVSARGYFSFGAYLLWNAIGS